MPGAARAGRCACSPTYRAKVYSKREGRWLKRSFDTLGEAKEWRRDTEVALRRGTVRATATPTLAEMAERWLAGAGRRHPQSLGRRLQAEHDPRL